MTKKGEVGIDKMPELSGTDVGKSKKPIQEPINLFSYYGVSIFFKTMFSIKIGLPVWDIFLAFISRFENVSLSYFSKRILVNSVPESEDKAEKE